MNLPKLSANLQLISKKIRFECKVESKPSIIVDYPQPQGDGEGHTSLELFLISLGSCLASTTKLMLSNYLKKQIDDLKIHIEGIRRNEHPTCFESITLLMDFYSDDLTQAELDKALEMSEKTFCPVLAMINDKVKINIETKIIPFTK